MSNNLSFKELQEALEKLRASIPLSPSPLLTATPFTNIYYPNQESEMPKNNPPQDLNDYSADELRSKLGANLIFNPRNEPGEAIMDDPSTSKGLLDYIQNLERGHHPIEFVLTGYDGSDNRAAVKIDVVTSDCREWFVCARKFLAFETDVVTKLEEIKFSLDDVIIPDQTKQDILSAMNQVKHSKKLFEDWGLGEVIEYGKGVTLLFFGPPGTGKTLIARKIAKALRYPLVELTTAELESSEPGQYERNLKAHFSNKKKQVIFLDECDSIIQSRQGMGQIMSGQNNFLLKAIEGFEGVLIMATNRIDSLDEALERRISMIIEFHAPDREARKKIWAIHLPKKMPLDEKFTVEDASKLELTGGQIKNIVLNAARFAVSEEADKVMEKHFERAIARVMKSKKAFSAPRKTGHQQDKFRVK